MLLRHTLLYLPAQFVAPLIQFVSIIIWAHILTPTDLGVVTLIMAVQELAFAAFFLWWSHYALRFIAGFRDDEARGRFLGTEVIAIALSTVLQTVILLPVLHFYFAQAMTPALLAVTTAFLVSRSLNNYMAERARSETRIALYSIMQIAGPLLGLLIGLGLIWSGQPGAISIVAGFAIAQAGSMLFAFTMSDVGRRLPKLDRAIFGKAASFGIPVMLAYMLALVAANAPRFVVEHVRGLAAVGEFSVGFGLGLRASAFAVMMVTAGAYPLVVRRMEREGLAAAYEQLAKNITLVAVVVVPVAFGLLAVNTAVVDLMVPEAYRAVTYLVLPCATIGGLLRALRAHTTDQVFLIRSRTGFTTLIAVIDLIFAVGLSYAGLMLYGVPGAAIGPMVSGAVTFTTSLLLSRWMLDFQVPWRAFGAIVLAAAVMAGIVAAVPAGHGYLGLGLRVALGGVIYPVLLALLLPMARQMLFGMAGKVADSLRRGRALPSR